MNINEATVQGFRKPCVHVFDTFQTYLVKNKQIKYCSNNPLVIIAQTQMGKEKYSTIKNWVADCPVCGELWLVHKNKKELIKLIKQTGKGFIEMDIKDSIRHSGELDI